MSVARANRTSEVLGYCRVKLNLNRNLEDLQQEYLSARPFPHLVLDNLFPAESVDAVLSELTHLNSDQWIYENHKTLVKSNMRSAVDLEENGFQFVSLLNSAGFLYLVSEITGVKGLLPDPYLTGAGYTVMGEGGKFSVHADRNTDHYSGLVRRMVLLIYLNKDWSTELGGQLELWSKDGLQRERSIEPIFNRVVLFEIADHNFHAVRPVADGSQRARLAFMSYYHTVGRDVIPHYSIYAPGVFQKNPSRLTKIAKEILPPFLFNALKHLGTAD
jgi:Rps23 Pro-64 3,4-dihydroxylase Tpa1-like proline 4-hydroxylase